MGMLSTLQRQLCKVSWLADWLDNKNCYSNLFSGPNTVNIRASGVFFIMQYISFISRLCYNDFSIVFKCVSSHMFHEDTLFSYMVLVCTIFKSFFKVPLFGEAYQHSSRILSFVFPCLLLMCRIKPLLSDAAYSHSSQKWSFILSCTHLMCLLKIFDVDALNPHSQQT